MQPQIVLRQITTATANFIHLPYRAGPYRYPRPNTIAVRSCPYGSYADPMAGVTRLSHQERRRLVQFVHGHAQSPVVQDIGSGGSTAGVQRAQRRTGARRDIFEVTVAQVAVQQLSLLITRVAYRAVNFGREMPVD